jgi:hypothetical protein
MDVVVVVNLEMYGKNIQLVIFALTFFEWKKFGTKAIAGKIE